MTRLEKATYAAIILACLFFVGTLARSYYLGRRPDPHTTPEIPQGAEIKLPEEIPSTQQPAVSTLALVLSKNCALCRESMGFYQKLAAFKNSSPQGLRLVAVLPESKEEAQAYLKKTGIGVDAVFSLPLSRMGVTGIPMLLLLNEQNKLEGSWAGKLSDAQESQVIDRLKKVCVGCSLPTTAAWRASAQVGNKKR
jgi:hypothetical protein